MLDISRLSARYDARRLDDAHADEILALCRGNAQFYEYCQAEPTREQVLNDLRIAPPGIGPADKYYVGFYRSEALVAVMDLIDGYPDPQTAFIGFFMMNAKYQGQGIGSAVVGEAAAHLKSIGIQTIRLAIDKGNPQSTHFWRKNGFRVVKEVDRNGWTILVAERAL